MLVFEERSKKNCIKSRKFEEDQFNTIKTRSEPICDDNGDEKRELQYYLFKLLTSVVNMRDHKNFYDFMNEILFGFLLISPKLVYFTCCHISKLIQ